MQIRFLLGPAGSGKTHECLCGIRDELRHSAEGDPIIFLAPRQATFQLERQLLETDDLPGYTRLNVFSFERLARFVFDSAKIPFPDLLSEEGRVMVLRALLEELSKDLRIFGPCAGRTGFADELSAQIREFQNHGLSPEDLVLWASDGCSERLRLKLLDLAFVYSNYKEWLERNELLDADALISCAADLLNGVGRARAAESEGSSAQPLKIASLYVDGFAQFSPEERRFLFALIERTERSTLAFCLETENEPSNLLSAWSVIEKTYQDCRTFADAIAREKVVLTILTRATERSRFSKSVSLGHLERAWNHPHEFKSDEELDLRLTECPNPNAEATLCAREIIRHVRKGGRYREVAVLARDFENDYPHLLQVTFRRYGIPYFLDHRESVSHHALAELTRGALRTLAYGWKMEDWFCVLKSGLVHFNRQVAKTNSQASITLEELENQALAHGWEGDVWATGFKLRNSPSDERALNELREGLVAPFLAFRERVKGKPNGEQLASSLQQLWSDLEVENQLVTWASESGDAVHDTVWTQVQEWLENVKLAFKRQHWSIREWIPIVEAGLNGLSVGVIPPVLDQVLVGAVDRSRNPDLKKVLILGFNEGVFPALPRNRGLLNEHDLDALRDRGKQFSPGPNLQIGEEQFFGYIACTRAREKVFISYARAGSDGKALNPSRFISHIQRIFPALKLDTWNPPEFLKDLEHLCELGPLWDGELASEPNPNEQLEPGLVQELYGRELNVSVSSMERFAMCPFRFFLEKGLRIQERVEFELDVREQGSFQHEVLSIFHEELKDEGKKWRDISVEEAMKRVEKIADAVTVTFRDGLLNASKSNQFTAECYKKALKEFIGVIVGWFESNHFDPEYVELPFEPGRNLPGWRIPLSEGKSLLLKGRVDRIDLLREKDGRAYCVVFDYKSGLRKPDELLLSKGIQGQLTGYLCALINMPEVKKEFGVKELLPGGCFLIPLRPSYSGAKSRTEALESEHESRVAGYTHRGLFNWDLVKRFDSSESGSGQFDYQALAGGGPSKKKFSALEAARFVSILENTETLLKTFGERIYKGEISIFPFRKGNASGCDTCKFPSICRFDPWKQPFNVLKKPVGDSGKTSARKKTK